MSNFDFLKNYDEKLYKSGINVEGNVNTSPAAVYTYATPFLQRVLELLLAEIGQKYNSRKEFYYQLDAVYRQGKIKYGFKDSIYSAYQLRNRLHSDIDEMEKSQFYIAQQLHEKLFYIAKKLYNDFFDDKDLYPEIPSFMPVEIESIDNNTELIKIPDFSEVIDMDYDYCIICGEPNHLNASLCCEKCNRVMDNANNFITIRNHFGEDKQFTKDDLLQYGIPEGYINQFINSMVREKMLDVKGRFITFNNMYLKDYLKKIDDYIAVFELITKFREDKISPKMIKQTREYKQGSRRQEPFYQFYKITNREIIKKFERDLIAAQNIWASIEYTTISEERLKRWYEIGMTGYNRGNVNEAFVVFNKLLIQDYLDLKKEGLPENEIKKQLNVSDDIYEFWCGFDKYFEKNLKKIKMDLLTKAILDGKTKSEVIEYAGISLKEYEDLVKFSEFKKDEFSKIRSLEIESRKKHFVRYLLNFDLRISCMKAKITLEDFYEFYDTSDAESEFFTKTTKILMDKYLYQRSMGKTEIEALEKVGITQKYLERWLKRSSYSEFKDRDLKVKVGLILKGLKKGKSLEEISEVSGVNENTIKSYIRLGERGSEIYRPLFEYYEKDIIPNKLIKFINTENKSIRKAQEAAKLSDEELEKYYQLGKSGNEYFTPFYEKFFNIKKNTYVYHISKGKSHKIAMRESQLSEEEYNNSKDDLDKLLRLVKFNIVLETIANNKTSNVAASKAGVSVEEIYEWYFKGRDGDDDYKKFYECFHKGYVRPSIVPLQEKLDNDNAKLNDLIRSNKDKFTKKDADIWLKHGLIKQGVIHLDDESDDDEDDVKEINFNSCFSRVSQRNSLGRVQNEEYDVEKLKKEILKKS